VLLNGDPVPVTSVADAQVGFLVPFGLPEGPAEVRVENTLGTSQPVSAYIGPVAPGIFVNRVAVYTARRGDILEISCTGLGPVAPDPTGAMLTTLRPQVFIGDLPAVVVSSGLAPGYAAGLYRVQVRVPSGLAPGPQTVSLSVNGVRGNDITITVE
jgi:uncharacterized protein (TIGR03437 family)